MGDRIHQTVKLFKNYFTKVRCPSLISIIIIPILNVAIKLSVNGSSKKDESDFITKVWE